MIPSTQAPNRKCIQSLKPLSSLTSLSPLYPSSPLPSLQYSPSLSLEKKSEIDEKTDYRLSSLLSDLSLNEKKQGKLFAMLKYFNEDKIRFVTTQILVSGYLLPGCLEALKKVINLIPPDKRKEVFALNISYAMIPNMRDKTGDTQPFLTETIECSDKNPHETAIHGIREELRMYPHDPESVRFVHQEIYTAKTKTPKTATWFHTNITNLTVCTDTKQSVKRPEIKKEQKDKIGCIVWGSLSEIEKTLKQLPIYSKKYDSDGICGILCISLDEMCQIIEVIQNENYGGYDKFYWYDNQRYKFAFSGRVCDESVRGTY